jgi:5-methylcytosine-specific restriction endonuclease McrA
MAAPPNNKLDEVVAQARRAREQREQSYRGQALKLYPHVCGRCGRDFTYRNLHELTVHHRDHNHDNNPSDGSNWELLCLYCHDNEHQRQLTAAPGIAGDEAGAARASHTPFADLASLLRPKKD